MIFIIHGDDYPKSRNTVLKLKNKLNTQNSIEFTNIDVQPTELYKSVNVFDIFSKPPLVIFEIDNKSKSNHIEYVEILKNKPKDVIVIVLAKKELPKSNEFIKNVKILNAKCVLNNIYISSNIFKLIDSTFQKNRIQSYNELAKLLKENTEPAYIYTMLLYGIRNITLTMFLTQKQSKLTPYSYNKFKKVSDIYTQQNLCKLYDYIYELEKKIKTGKIDYSSSIILIIEKVLT